MIHFGESVGKSVLILQYHFNLVKSYGAKDRLMAKYR